eukprot:TRINITY_DN32069_c0_g1_i1.p1 TRINITY_DN32069_c0_g1~~TRINITY_DN32069_c0_g1_i1.p1  ORF type:complete len:634 (+),score=156.48 TRINITY_DN32069_c0_g1_i1:118-2019(+)
MARRDKLISMQQRENEKDQLLKMFRERYFGPSDDDLLANGIVDGEVNLFIASAAPMTAANLGRLERRLQGRIFHGHADPDLSSNNSVSAYTTGSNPAASVNSRTRSTGDGGAGGGIGGGEDEGSVSAYTAGSNPAPSISGRPGWKRSGGVSAYTPESNAPMVVDGRAESVRSGGSRYGSSAARVTAPSVKSVRAGPPPPGSLSARLATPSAASMKSARADPMMPSGSLSARGQSSRPGTGALSIAGDALCAASHRTPSAPRPVRELTQALAGQVQNSLEWSVLDKVAAQLHKQETTMARQRELELRQKIRSDLDKQVADEKLKQEREKEADKQMSLMEAEASRLWSEDQVRKDQLRIELVEKQKRECQEQARLTQQRREQEKLHDRELEKDMVQRINVDLERDRRVAEERLKKSQEASQQALKESCEALKQREEEQRQISLREKQSVEAYEALYMERVEAKRQKEEQDREKRRMNELKAEDLAAATRRSADQSEMKMVADRAAQDRAAEIAEKANQQKLQTMRHQTQTFLLEQIKEKHNRKAQDTERVKQFAKALEEDNAKFHAKEQEKQKFRRKVNWEHRQELEKQMKSKIGMSPNKECMSESELRLNKNLLEKVTLALTDISSRTGTAKHT